jgi:hypothetical protein
MRIRESRLVLKQMKLFQLIIRENFSYEILSLNEPNKIVILIVMGNKMD